MSVPSPKAFAAPWEAQVFALVVSLQEAGLFTWAEWTDRLGREIRPADGPERAADYSAWLATLETILAERGVAAAESVAVRTEAFLRAAAATPHGQSIRLENDPLYRP
ncbi:nitrile hydratase accessory protein [Methylobacterium sp. J-048]|uniref:nitrile hydratase accessory protein n=1 Tax=Methylobacterium sp. J-048 TaxID=2836635 RepID=UPI001FBA5BC5|nr:nitrile hydratase accessory protein [Methylobacterium sp. J-048]MCJ2057577.1 nitrile hydratase accessory protein [Methylobacterium sp. J-048]